MSDGDHGKRYRLYVLDSSISPALRQAAKRAIDRSAPRGSQFIVARDFRDLTSTLERLSTPQEIARRGRISDMTIVAHGGFGGSFSLGRDLVGHPNFDGVAKPYGVFGDHARIDIIRCQAGVSTPIERRSLYQKIGSKLLPAGGRVGGTVDDVEFFEKGGVRLTRGRSPVGGRWPRQPHLLEALKLAPQESVEIAGPNEQYRIFRPLRQGSRGLDVKRLQRFLGTTPDGDFGSRTRTALANWQRRRGLEATGIADAETFRAIRRFQREMPRTFRTLSEGSRGEDVKRLQRFLKTTPDGLFGPKTRTALTDWQRGVGLSPDGIAGSRTFRAINRLNGGNPLVFRTMRTGMRGEDVRRLQRTIGAKEDGIFGPETKRRLVDWQRRHGLGGDGVAGYNTLSRMQANLTQRTNTSRTLRIGLRGEDVRRLQLMLGTRPDGIFGPQTQSTLRTWQRQHGLRGDGIAGPRTHNALLSMFQP